MSQVKEIVLLFAELSETDKEKCLRTLKYQAGAENIIPRFSEKHQQVYKQNISFVRTPPRKGDTFVEITLKTAFGNFIAEGLTVQEAKLNAVNFAQESEFEDEPKVKLEFEDNKY